MRYALKRDESQWGSGRRSKRGAKAALLMSGDDGMVQTALIAPLLASIAVAYPAADILLVDTAMSITATAMIPAMLLTSFLARFFNKKHLIMFGTALFMTAGVTAMFAPSIEALIAWRAVLGIGAGMAFPLVPSSIAYLFVQEESNQMLGWMNAVGALLSFTLSMAAGWIALLNWRYAFLFYLIFVPVLILQGVFLPNFKPERIEERDGSMLHESLNGKMFLACACMLLFMVLAMVSTFRLSFLVELNGIGDSSVSGTATSCMTCASFLISCFFVHYLDFAKRFAPCLSIFFAFLAFFVLSNANAAWMAYAGMALQGLAMGTLNPFLMSYMSKVAPDSRKTLGMTLMCICQLAGQIFTPYYIMAVTAMGFASDAQLFSATGVVFGLVAIVLFIFAAVYTAKEKRR